MRRVPAGGSSGWLIASTSAHQSGQNTLGKQRIGQVEPCEFVLAWFGRHGQLVEQPLVQRPVIFEFQGADRMSNSLDRIRLAVGIVVAWIYRPLVAGARV